MRFTDRKKVRVELRYLMLPPKYGIQLGENSEYRVGIYEDYCGCPYYAIHPKLLREC